MSHLLRPIMMLSICFTSLSCACYPEVAGACYQSGRQSFNQGELGLASTQRHNAIPINSGSVEAYSRLGLTDATLGLCSDARCVQEDAKLMDANLAPTGAQQAAHELKLSPPAWVLTVSYTAVARKFSRVSESIVVTPEPVSLALFGSGLTLVGVALLRCSRRTKGSRTTRVAHYAVNRSCVRLARHANRVQYPVPDFLARDRSVIACMSSAPK